MTEPDELGRTMAAIAAALRAVGARWAVGGSLASAAYGEPRATNDVDVIAALDEGGAASFCAHLGKDFDADADAARGAVRYLDAVASGAGLADLLGRARRDASS